MDWMTGPGKQRALAALGVVIGGALLIPLVMQLPLLAWDWQVCFEARDSLLAPAGNCYDQYPPWTYWTLRPWTILPWRIGLAFQLGILLMAVAVSVSRGAHRWVEAMLLALLTPPVWMLMWLGQTDGLAMWGLMFFPLGMLWALTKPNITVWAIFARWQWVVWAAAMGAVSLLIWGWWPGRLLAARGMCQTHPSAMGWGNVGWPILVLGLLLFPFSGRNPLRLMAAGVMLMPFVMPYHFLMLLPALGKVHGWRRWLLWLLAWTTVVPATGSAAKCVAFSFPIAVWITVSPRPFQRYRILACKVQALFETLIGGGS